MSHPRETMDTMAERYARPDWVRRINAMGESVGGAQRLIPMDPESLSGKFGVHRYTPEEWGFDPAEVRARLAPYTDHYGVELEV